ncbi:rod shape-determining protein MreD [Paraflavitalea pollutisoli]|uniref:rod shape-determining protein MreD n=1 Tax=Paraflavitalea pollutisoli TaxID=3034143 RepID=UPI0023EE0FD9|nr:rod shape-determining protein MreD [Paraflavitalea sp. H1-2-19X]
MSDLVKNIIRFALFIFIQVFVLFQIQPLHRFVIPYIYFLYILWLPFRIPRVTLTLVGFLFGLTLDFFTVSPGLHAAACTMIAYLRPFLINILIPQEGAEQNYKSPSITSMGLAPYATYILILTLVHNIWLVLLEWINVSGNFWFFLGKVLATSGISLLLILVTELLFYRKEKFRTNTA